MRLIGRLSLIATLSSCLPAWGAPVYVVRVDAVSALNPSACAQVAWRDNLVFYNLTSTVQTIRLLEVSNGGLRRPPALELQVAPGRSVNGAGHVNWVPASGDPVWVTKLDVPAGVVMRSRVEAGFAGCVIGGIPPAGVPDFGAFTLPTFDGLVPAGHPQVLLGADLGAQASSANLGVYNDGLDAATALVEVHQVCDDALLETSSFAIPGKSLRQVGGVGATETACPSPGSETNAWLRYVKVTVDQPGFSYIVNRANAIPNNPLIPYAAP